MLQNRTVFLFAACAALYAFTACSGGAPEQAPNIPALTPEGGNISSPESGATLTPVQTGATTEEQIINCTQPSVPGAAITPCEPCLRYAQGAFIAASINFDGWVSDNVILSTLRSDPDINEAWNKFDIFKPAHACFVMSPKTGPKAECNPDAPNSNMDEMDCFLQNEAEEVLIVAAYENADRVRSAFAEILDQAANNVPGVDPADGIDASAFAGISRLEKPSWTEKNIYIAKTPAPDNRIIVGMAQGIRNAVAPAPSACPAGPIPTVMGQLRAANLRLAALVPGEKLKELIPLAVTNINYAAGLAFNLGGEKAFAHFKVFRGDMLDLLDPEFELLTAIRPDAIENSWFAEAFEKIKAGDDSGDNSDLCGGDCTGQCHSMGPRDCFKLVTREECIRYYGLDWQQNPHNCAWGTYEGGKTGCFFFGREKEDTCALPSAIINPIDQAVPMDILKK